MSEYKWHVVRASIVLLAFGLWVSIFLYLVGVSYLDLIMIVFVWVQTRLIDRFVDEVWLSTYWWRSVDWSDTQEFLAALHRMDIEKAKRHE